ncbi:MAG: hypothetical protein HY650_07380 [Acidobacteria bacterium]|nr:hypothetical protein [Acidobacteriota bacterium]
MSANKVRLRLSDFDWSRPPTQSMIRLVQDAQGSTSLVPPIDSALLSSIEESRKMTQLDNDWDGEGSPGYSPDTWRRAIDFLKHYAIAYWCEYFEPVIPPKILPGPGGSIDLYWKRDDQTLLINLPSDQSLPAEYFGDKGPGDTRKAKLNLDNPDVGLLAWFMR